MEIKTGKLRECFAFLPSLHLNWIEESSRIYYLQFGWLYWYLQIKF